MQPPCELICLWCGTTSSLKAPQRSTFTASILPSQTHCKWWETLLMRVFSHQPVSITQSLYQSGSSADRRHKPARATLLSNTQELCRSCCAKNPRGSCCHSSHFIKPWISLCMELLWLLVRSSWSQRRRKSPERECEDGHRAKYSNNWLLVWIRKRDSLLTSSFAGSECTSTLCFTRLQRKTLTLPDFNYPFIYLFSEDTVLLVNQPPAAGRKKNSYIGKAVTWWQCSSTERFMLRGEPLQEAGRAKPTSPACRSALHLAAVSKSFLLDRIQWYQITLKVCQIAVSKSGWVNTSKKYPHQHLCYTTQSNSFHKLYLRMYVN